MGAETTFAMLHTSGWMNEMQFTKQSVVEIFHDFHTFPINSHELFWTVYESVNAPEKPKETAAKLLFWKSVQELENRKQAVVNIEIWDLLVLRGEDSMEESQLYFTRCLLTLRHYIESENQIFENIFYFKSLKISLQDLE